MECWLSMGAYMGSIWAPGSSQAPCICNEVSDGHVLFGCLTFQLGIWNHIGAQFLLNT